MQTSLENNPKLYQQNSYPENNKVALLKNINYQRITDACISKIKDISISEVIGNFVKLKKQGSSSVGLCPFHNEKTASFHVDEIKGIYKCFGCGKSGDAIEFIRENENKNFIESCITIAEIGGIQLEYVEKDLTDFEIEKLTAAQLQEEVLNFVVKKYRKNLLELNVEHPVKKYLFSRGYSEEIISKWQIGWAGTNWKFVTTELINKNWFDPAKKLGIIRRHEDRNYDGFRSRIIIPITDKNGKYIGLSGRYFEEDPLDNGKEYPKYINSNECELFKKSMVLFGLNYAAKLIKQANHAVIVEGYFDVISSHGINRENTIGTCGTSFTQEQMTLLKKYTSHVRMMSDNDEAGIKSFNRALPELLRQGFKVEVVEYDQKYKDPDEMIHAEKTNNDFNKTTKHFATDAVIFRAKKLWQNAENDPDEKAIAIEEIANLVCCIENETKRSTYTENLQKVLSIKGSLLKKQVRKNLLENEAKAQEQASHKKFNSLNTMLEVDGLAEGFNGNIHDAIKYGIYEHAGILWTRGSNSDRPITNFTMKIIYHFLTNDNKAYRLLSIKSVYGFDKMILIDTDDFVSLGSFKKIIARHGDYVFKGNDSDLTRLQELLQKDEVKSEYIGQMGYNKKHKFYAFCNGIVPQNDSDVTFLPIDKYGIVQHQNKNYFIPGMSEMYKEKDELFESEKKFKYRDPRPDFGFGEWASLFFDVYGDKSKAAIPFFLAAIFRDIIFRHMLRFPMLNLYGPPQFGKGSLAESLLYMFGEKQAPVMLEAGSTKVGMQRKIAFVSNGFVFLDEYKNSLNKEIIGSLKSIYDGQGRVTGKMSNDLQTQVTTVKSAVIIGGQDIPTIDPALYTRMIMLSFTEGKFTDKDRALLSKLQDMEIDGGFSDITASLLKHRQLIESKFKDTFELISRETFREVSQNEIEDRMIRNISILLSIVYLLKNEVTMPFTYEECKSFLISNMIYQHSILIGNDDVSKFWAVVESLCNEKRIKYGREYILKDGFIFVRLKLIHPLYLKELKLRNDSNGLTTVESLRHYLSLDKQIYVEEKRQRFPDGSNSRCDKLKYLPLNIELPLFEDEDNYGSSETDKIARFDSKYREMGIDTGNVKNLNDELPF